MISFWFWILFVAGEHCETDAIRQIRSGMYDIILPRTHEQFYTTADTFAMKKIHCRHLLASQYLKTKLSTIDRHKKSNSNLFWFLWKTDIIFQVLQSAFEHDYPNLEKSYAPLKDLTCPALIIWGDKDQVRIVSHFWENLQRKFSLLVMCSWRCTLFCWFNTKYWISPVEKLWSSDSFW